MSRLAFYRRVLAYFRPDARRVLLLLGLIALSTLLGLASVWPMALLVDTVLVPAAEHPVTLPAVFGGTRTRQIVALAVGMFLLRVMQEAIGAWRNLLNIGICHDGLLRVRCDLFRKLQILSLPFHRSQAQGDTIYRLSSDATGCQQILNVLVEVLVAAFTLVVMLAIMFARSTELTLIALCVVPLLLVTNILFGQALGDSSRDARRLESDFTSTVQRSVASIGLMQAFGRQGDGYRLFRGSSEMSLHAWYKLHRQMALYRVCVGFIFGAGAAAILGYGGWQVHRDQFVTATSGGLTVGSLVVFLTYLGMLYDPLCKLTGAGANVLGGITGMERVFEVLDRHETVTDVDDAIHLPVQPRTLTLNNVSFAYDAARPVLRNVTLTIGSGEMIAFVGSSGAGKSTILNLVCRFFDPTSGQVELDGVDIRGIRLADLRRHMAVVLQECVLLPTTIAENIAYGRPKASLEDIRRAAEMVGAAEFIEALPHGYHTQLAEAGQTLSGGQRQRIAIARALLTEAPIIVLDEPTSALDAENEQLVTETLARLKGKRTVILVSHRLSTVVHCDRVLVLHEGRIADQGASEDVLARRGWYPEAARQQFSVISLPRAA